MTTAFGQFDEPLAWIIRGLIEYGWVDITRNKVLPPNTVGGFDLSFIPDSQGQTGLMLRVPAVAGQQRCHEDENYNFEVKLIQIEGAAGFAVRSEACNYLQEFVFSPDHPIWAAGYIHQGLTDYVGEFVRWRLGGGELTWAQRQGVPDVNGGPCSASFASWVEQQLGLHREFDATLWGQGVQTSPSTSNSGPVTPMVTVGNYGTSKESTTPAKALIEGPAKAIFAMICMGGAAAVMAFLNIFVTIALFGFTRPFALVTSLFMVLFAGGGGVAAWFGWREYRSLRGSVMPWIAIVYPALVPLVCLGGIPVSIWAAKRWQSEAIMKRREINKRRQ